MFALSPKRRFPAESREAHLKRQVRKCDELLECGELNGLQRDIVIKLRGEFQDDLESLKRRRDDDAGACHAGC